MIEFEYLLIKTKVKLKVRLVEKVCNKNNKRYFRKILQNAES